MLFDGEMNLVADRGFRNAMPGRLAAGDHLLITPFGEGADSSARIVDEDRPAGLLASGSFDLSGLPVHICSEQWRSMGDRRPLQRRNRCRFVPDGTHGIPYSSRRIATPGHLAIRFGCQSSVFAARVRQWIKIGD